MLSTATLDDRRRMLLPLTRLRALPSALHQFCMPPMMTPSFRHAPPSRRAESSRPIRLAQAGVEAAPAMGRAARYRRLFAMATLAACRRRSARAVTPRLCCHERFMPA